MQGRQIVTSRQLEVPIISAPLNLAALPLPLVKEDIIVPSVRNRCILLST